MKTYDETIDDIDEKFMIHEACRVMNHIKRKTDGIIYCRTGKSRCTTQLMNTSGLNYEQKHSIYYIAPSLKMTNSAAGINKFKAVNCFKAFEPGAFEEVLSFYRHSQNVKDVPTKKMKILVHEQALDALIWRFRAACQGETIFRESPP